MGLMRLRLKGYKFRLITDIQFIQCITILFGLFNLSVCLFEDQIGKFDWKQSYVGQIKFAHFDTVSTAKKIILATEENVVAALNLKSGQIIWRQVLEKAQQGQIQHLHVHEDIVTVSGNSPWLIRTWDPSNGRILSEWSFSLTTPLKDRKVLWFVSSDSLVQVIISEMLHYEISRYDYLTGYNNGTTEKISAPWIQKASNCVLSNSILTCLSEEDNKSTLIYTDISTRSSKILKYPLHSIIGERTGPVKITALNSQTAGIVLNQNNKNFVVLLDHERPKLLDYNIPAETNSFHIMEHDNKDIMLLSTPMDTNYKITSVNLKTLQETDLSTVVKQNLGNGKIFGGICATKRDKNIACRYLVVSSDNTISFVQNNGKVLWSREEALSHIVAVDLLDLPVSDLDASIETEFDTKEVDFVSMLTRRLSSQINQLHLLLVTVLGGKHPQSTNQQNGLVRDEFGLHKIIIAVTKIGKIFGIDNLSGAILWSKNFDDISPFVINDKETMMLYTQRTTRHFPKPAQCALVTKDKKSGEGVIIMFNPITGELTNDGIVRIGTNIKQVMLLPKPNEDFLREVLILDEKDNLHIYPKGNFAVFNDIAKQTFMFTANSNTGILNGYSLGYSNSEQLLATPTWQLKLGTKEQRVKLVVSKVFSERVHSQGRVLIDRSVLYKYVNPNLVAVVTHGPDSVHKHVMNIYLIDVVSGSIIFSISHKRAKEPIHLVHSENWLVYSYFNDKWRRTEIGTLELYEGKVQSNSSAFSSLAPPMTPLVERQSYILPTQVDEMQVTLTEKGITSKHVLMALNNGGVIEMPWMFLDPRRPATVTPEMREEGIVPYIPELPLPSEAIINYNQSLARIRGIHVSPSGLESTCLVLVHGLDLFYTRVAPSKTFDLLKDDFDYSLIVIVLTALVVTSYISKQLSSRKALKQAWK